MRTGKGWFVAAGALLALAAFFRFALVGYAISAGCCVFFAAVCAFFGLMRRRRTKTARSLTWLCIAGLAVLLALFLIAEIPVLADMRSDEDTDAPYAIVFGAGVNGTEPSLSLVERLTAALSWLEEHPGGVVIVSGCQGAGEDISEARAMADWLTARGVAPERIVLEEQARSSYENLTYSLALIGERGGDPRGRVALISSEYHLHRLRVLAEGLGCEPVCAAARTGHTALLVNYAVREAFAAWHNWVLGPA